MKIIKKISLLWNPNFWIEVRFIPKKISNFFRLGKFGWKRYYASNSIDEFIIIELKKSMENIRYLSKWNYIDRDEQGNEYKHSKKNREVFLILSGIYCYYFRGGYEKDEFVLNELLRKCPEEEFIPIKGTDYFTFKKLTPEEKIASDKYREVCDYVEGKRNRMISNIFKFRDYL